MKDRAGRLPARSSSKHLGETRRCRLTFRLCLLLSCPLQIRTIHPAHDVSEAVEVIDLSDTVPPRISVDRREGDRQRAAESRWTIRVQVPECLPAEGQPGGKFRPALQRRRRLAQFLGKRFQPVGLVAPL